MSDAAPTASGPFSNGLPFTTASGPDVRVRICPSPTGVPHVGLVRTALFNWAYARHTGGVLVFRIEDTDAARDSEESFEQIVDAFTWSGIRWDEGIGIGGPHEPYRQSERGDVYADVLRRLIEAGHVYESFSTAEEIDARNEANGRPKQQGYDNFDRTLTEAERAEFRALGREPSWRLKVPDVDLGFHDLVRGDITFPAGSTTDFVVVRPNGVPLYTFVNPVDDALMGITHVLRGEDLLPSTPRQIALYLALIDVGVTDFIPQFAHLPTVLGEGNKKLSKRNPESNLFLHRDRGFIPEGLSNYLALLGWSLAPDRDVFSMDEMVAAFDVVDVNSNPARFDQKKADAINAAHIRLLEPDDFAERLVPFLAAAGVVDQPLDERQQRILSEAAPLIQTRVTVLGESVSLLAPLFRIGGVDDYDEDALASLPEQADEVGRAAIDALAAVPESEWNTERIRLALEDALIGRLGLKPRVAFGPVRVAVSGQRVSPPLFESLAILGRDETLARLSLFLAR